MVEIKEYSNGEIRVIWEAEKYIHSAIYSNGLPEIFRPRLKP